MTRTGAGGRWTGGCRRRAVRAGLVGAVLLLAGCPSPSADVDSVPTHRPAPATDAAPSASVTAWQQGTTLAPDVSVDLASGGRVTEAAIDVAGTAQGGAVVLLATPGEGARLVPVTAEGRPTGSVPLPGLGTPWDLLVRADGTALVTGRLADEEALGHAVVDLATGAARTVVTVPLEEATSHAVGTSALSADGRTVWLYSTTLADGRYLHLLTGSDVATGDLLASRDLFPEFRGIQVPEQEPELVGLAPLRDGGVLLAVNVFPPQTIPFPQPTVLVYDASLRPRTTPLAVAPADAGVTARALATAPDGGTWLVLRGSSAAWLVALPPDGLPPGARAPQPRLEVPGFAHTDELAVGPASRVVLPGPAGARTIDLVTGAAVDVDLGCPGRATVRALVGSPGTGTWALGGCLEAGALRPTLWRIA